MKIMIEVSGGIVTSITRHTRSKYISSDKISLYLSMVMRGATP